MGTKQSFAAKVQLVLISMLGVSFVMLAQQFNKGLYQAGLWLLIFVLIHVKQFKYGTEYVAAGSGVRDLYRLEMENLSNPLVVGFYIVSMIVVGSHLWHGVASAFQSLGVDHPRVTPKLLVAGKLLAVLIAAGFIVIAAWVYLTQSGRVHA